MAGGRVEAIVHAHSGWDQMTTDRRVFLQQAAAAGALAWSSSGWSQTGGVFTPESFGAKGDGVTNDTRAFAALSDAVNAAGGGRVVLRKAVYIVGSTLDKMQPSSGGPVPMEILRFIKCRRPVTVEGNGAVLRCQPGLRFGTFNLRTGAPVTHKLPYYNPQDRLSPYHYMIQAVQCSGSITIQDLELDGNLPKLRIGGPFGDTGWQIAGSGIFLIDNAGDEIVRNVYSHHHGQDGLMIDGLDQGRPAVRRIERLRSEYNGRQGCSLVGGRGYAFSNCKFNHTGKGGIYSAPGAGVDIEAEGNKTNREHSFTDCEFADNTGVGMLADSGPSSGAEFTRCRFVGTTAWSLWPNKPGFTFRSCTVVGAMVRPAVVTDRRLATTFIDCAFTDDPAKSPTGQVFIPGGTSTIADLNELGNPVFDKCRFLLTKGAVLPWSIKAVYRDCVMSQASPKAAYPRGTYEGTSTIRGNVDLYGSQFPGTVVLNGKSIGRAAG
jgi:Right handed beta helix region